MGQIRGDLLEQVWVADITHLPTDQGFIYLSLVMGAWSREILNYHVHDSLYTVQVSQELKTAIKVRQMRQALGHPPDRVASSTARTTTRRSIGVTALRAQ